MTARNLTIHADARGDVREAYRASWFPEVPPIVQVVRSESGPNVMRAMHSHRLQYDVWHFVKGRAFVQLYDPASEAFSAEWYGPGSVLVIPPGVAHGFYTDTGCILTYFLTREYDGTDEYEFDAFDRNYPGAFSWPGLDAIRSVRDRTAQSFDVWKAKEAAGLG